MYIHGSADSTFFFKKYMQPKAEDTTQVYANTTKVDEVRTSRQELGKTVDHD